VTRLSGLLAATATGVLLVLGTPVAASAVPAAIDPACTDFGLGGFIEVGDPAELDADLPAGVTVDDMSCVLDFSGAGEDIRIYAYLTDPFAVFLDKARFFAAAGWTPTEALDDGTEVPADLAGLEAREGEGEINLVFRRGLDGAGLYYATDSGEATFGLGTFLAVFQAPGGGAAGFDVPSSISDLRTIGDAVPTPAQGGILVVSAALLTLLLAIPAFLLSRVLSARYAQWFGWLERGRLGRWRAELSKPRNAARRWLFLAIGAVLAAFIAGFIDPRFGVNGLSVRLFLTLLATFALFNVGAWAVVTLVLRRVQPDAKPALTFHPASLLVVAVAVLLSRLLDFDPGIVFGLVAGTTFAVTLALSKEAIVILTGTAFAAGVGLLAWIGYSVAVANNPLDAGAVALTELLGGLTIEGVSTLPIALVPLATLDGGILFRWRRGVWVACYAVGLALFMLVLFNLPGGDTPADGDFVRWVVVFVVFAVVATGVWLVDYLTRRKTTADTTA
jgi:hypothetical protein